MLEVMQPRKRVQNFTWEAPYITLYIWVPLSTSTETPPLLATTKALVKAPAKEISPPSTSFPPHPPSPDLSFKTTTLTRMISQIDTIPKMTKRAHHRKSQELTLPPSLRKEEKTQLIVQNEQLQQEPLRLRRE